MSAALPWIHALGWTLLHFLWQGLVVGAGYAAARALLPKSHCNARYAVGLGALALLAAWPLATLIALRPQGAVEVAFGAQGLVAGGVATLAAAEAFDLAASIDRVLPWLVLLWLVGVLGVAGRALHQWRRFSRIARQWAESSPELDAMLAALTRRFGFMRRVRVLVSERIDTPMLLGWIRPVVLLPTAVALGFPRQQVELILAHELGHLRRYDHLVNLAQTVLETLLFYHPVVHWISREVRNERELCCDALVLRLVRGEPREYARTLAALEELRQTAAPVVLAASGGQLIERVRRIVGLPAPRAAVQARHPGRWLLIGTAFIGALFVAERIERANRVFSPMPLSVDWIRAPDVRALPFAALALPYERPRLRLAAVAPPEPAPTAPVASVPATAAGAVAAAAASSSRETVPAAVAAPKQAPLANLPAPATPTANAASLRAPAAAPATTAPAKAKPDASAPLEPVAAPAAPKPPVATYVVAPSFPNYYASQSGRVEATFTIAEDGSVKDIKFVGAKDGAFERAAERALRQWRFDPATLPDQPMRYTQAFVFAPKGRGNTHEECVQSTGSLICRDPSDGRAAQASNLNAWPPKTGG
ncbi:MAG TPA: M56 family metallopeptidase [Dokdonella sp.]|nr:M56 family metallopeptidase [Dokdonella sp.]